MIPGAAFSGISLAAGGRGRADSGRPAEEKSDGGSESLSSAGKAGSGCGARRSVKSAERTGTPYVHPSRFLQDFASDSVAGWPFDEGIEEMFGRIHLSAALIGASTAVLLGIAPAGAAEIDDLKAKVEALEKRLGTIESTSVSISGYVKGDFYLDNRDDLGNTFGNGAGVRLDNAAATTDDGAVGMHAQQSRFALSTSTPTSFGALNTVAEIGFDPYADAPGSPFVRLANGSLGPVLAGLAWSIRGDDHTGADTVDFDGPAGVVATRKPQLRLTLPLAEGFTGQMAVEPAIRGNELPTFLAALRYSSGVGAVNVTGAMGRYDDDTGQNVSTHSFHVGAHLNVTDATRVMATLNMTSGDAQIYGGNSAVTGGANLDDDDELQPNAGVTGDLKAQESIGGFAGVSHGWSDSMRSGVYFGWVRNDAPGPGLNKAVQTLHANVIWSPVSQADIGFEVMHGSRETKEGAKGEAMRVQIGVKYSF